jgi:CHAT domain-containing protein
MDRKRLKSQRRSLPRSKRWFGLLLLVFIGFMTTLLPVQVQAVPNHGVAQVQTNQHLSEQDIDLLQRGKSLYEAGSFSEAIAPLRQAATTFEAQREHANQAIALVYLASALEPLERWQEANQAIQQAIGLLTAPTLKRQPNTTPILAQALNVQGILQLAQGQESAALETWQHAEAIYRSLNDLTGVLGNQMNQAKALQALGFYRRATTLLQQVNQSLQTQPDSLLKLAGLRNLGNVLQVTGDLQQSRTLLQQSLAIAKKLRDERQISEAEADLQISSILQNLGNTARAQGETDAALTFYRQVAAIAPATRKIQAEILQLSLLVQVERWMEAQTLWSQIQPHLADLPLDRPGIYARIQLAQALMGKNGQDSSSARVDRLVTPITIAQLLAQGIEQARSLNDRRAESYATGVLGHLYEQTQQWQVAQSLTQQALILAQEIDAPDVAYQWQWQLGRLLARQEERNPSGNKAASVAPTSQRYESAIAAYTEAFNTLQTLRSDLVAMNPDVQFSFRESVEPLYRQFVELLLQGQDGQPRQKHLRQARQVIESLQLAELDNFFREACLDARPVQIDRIDAKAAVIYPIILPEQLAVVLSLPNQPLSYYRTALPQSETERIIDKMQQSLRETAFLQERLPIAQQVYDLLIRPLQSTLKANEVETLVFVLDGSLRNLPMAALHDGQQYLIENYSIGLAPSLQLLQPQPLKRQPLKGLLGGLSQSRQGFPALPNVEFEINQIQSQMPAQILLDQTFTNTAVQNKIDTTPFPIVHLATHGQFSSNVDETFVLTWDGRITVKQLDQFLQTREREQRSVELLVLSACETAAGDRRAALGMAGFAVRSGARSTLATLWAVNDRSTSLLMVKFYQAIAQAGVTKAEALRRAQLTLLKQPKYENPYYWAPFILLGNWL